MLIYCRNSRKYSKLVEKLGKSGADSHFKEFSHSGQNFQLTGTQSLYDVATADLFLLVRFSGSTFTLTAVLSRFEVVTSAATENQLFLTAVCSLYCLAFVSVSVQSGLLCILRIVCLTNLTFVESVVGENRTRLGIAVTTVTLAVAACVAQNISGDINSGTAYALLTGHAVTTGTKIIYLAVHVKGG